MALAADLRTIRHLRAEQVVHRLWARLRRPWFASPVYRGLLATGDDAPPVNFPPALWPGDAEHGRAITAGTIRLLNVEAPMVSPVDWTASGKTELWRFTLHYFEWLADLAAAGGAQAADAARTLVADWIGRHGKGPATGAVAVWHPYPLSLRLFAWMAYGPMLLDGAPDRFRHAFSAALHRQARHLARCVEWDVGGNHVVKNLKALVVAGRCLPGHEAAGRRALQDLESVVGRQVLADGGHEERSPSYHLQVLMDLMDLQATLGSDAPAWLDEAIGRMGTALATYRLGDGGLALFNDGDIGVPRLLATAGERLPANRRAPADALPETGYQRLAAGGTVVLMDTGKCCPDDLPAHAHADTLAFEMSSGIRRLIVNCGTYAYQDPAWRDRLRGTASHSTVTVDGEDSAEVHGTFRLGRRPLQVTGSRCVTEAGQEAEGSHDGYRHIGWRHGRKLSLDTAGSRLTGSDRLEPVRDAGRQGEAVARFHLHPDVAVEPDGEGGLRLTSREEVWDFTSPQASLAVEPSVYAPRFGEMRETRQIVLRLSLPPRGAAMAWALERRR